MSRKRAWRSADKVSRALNIGLRSHHFGCTLKTVPTTVGATGRYLWQRVGQEHIPASGVPECGGGPFGVGSQRLKRCGRGDRTQQRQGGAQAAQAHAQLMNAFRVTTILGCRLVRQHVDMGGVEDLGEGISDRRLWI